MEFSERFIFSEMDLNERTIISAYNWSSFNPKRHVIGDRSMYVNDMTQCKEKLILAAITDEQKEEAVNCFDYLKKKYLELRNIYYSAQSRCASSAVTGGSGFNVSRAQKANNVSHNREGDFWTWRESALDKALNRVNKLSDNWKTKRAIKSGDANALELLNQKLTDLKAKQEAMKAANKIKKLSFETWELSNNNAVIKNTEQRILEVSKKLQQVTKEVERESGITIVENVELDRLQMLFNGKPTSEIITDLKKNGFRWSPTNSAWQAFLTPNAKYKCAYICKTHNL